MMKPKIVLFSTPSCSWCKKIKEYLKSNGFNFKEIDVSRDSAARADMIRKTGQEGVPQTWINNRPVVGFDRAKLDRLLEIKK
jgi:glutaredoxin-like YruB-family protein